MAFHDSSKSSLSDLLRILKSTTDDPTVLLPTSTSVHQPPSNNLPNLTSRPPSAIPSKRQLDDLLSSLNGQPAHSTPSSAFLGGRSTLIEPFGPVGKLAGPAKLLSESGARSEDVPSGSGSDQKGKGKGTGPPDRRHEEGWRAMGFAKALPILSELLGDEMFKKELKKMKADQDALERRLWAKQERLKAEHVKVIQAEKDIARIARRPIPREKEKEWALSLSSSLADFHTHTCLPALDGLARRQREKLEELGVPGLGGEGQKDMERVRRIMDLLEVGLEE